MRRESGVQESGKRTLDRDGSTLDRSGGMTGPPECRRKFGETKFVLYRQNTNIAKRKIELVKATKKKK